MTSLKDEAAIAPLARADRAPSRSTSSSTRPPFPRALDEGGGTVLDAADAPVLQVVLAGVGVEAWRASPRGLGPADLAMHVALPEIDGRILTRAISFKAATRRATRDRVRARRRIAPLADRVAFVADLAASWARLRRKPRGGEAPRLRPARLSGAGRPHRLRRRARHAAPAPSPSPRCSARGRLRRRRRLRRARR